MGHRKKLLRAIKALQDEQRKKIPLLIPGLDRLTDENIRLVAPSDAIYQRGLDLYNDNRILSVSQPNPGQFRAVALGTPNGLNLPKYEYVLPMVLADLCSVDIKFDLERGQFPNNFSSSCRCPWQSANCKHVLATLFVLKNRPEIVNTSYQSITNVTPSFTSPSKKKPISPPENSTTPKKPKTSSKEYFPKVGTGGYGIMLALYNSSQPSLSREEIKQQATSYCSVAFDKEISNLKTSTHKQQYTAWNSMKTLQTNELVNTIDTGGI
jgi:hypothetical protein